MTGKKIIVQFTILTFCIAYLMSGAVIVLVSIVTVMIYGKKSRRIV